MKTPTRNEVPFDRQWGRGHFPFGLGRQPSPRPARERVGFEIADGTDGLAGNQFALATERELDPTAVPAMLVKG